MQHLNVNNNIAYIRYFQSIKTYIQEKNPKYQFFNEAQLCDGVLTKKTERVLFQSLYSYIVEKYSYNPPQNDIIECFKTTLKLFLYLETKPSDFHGIVSVDSIEFFEIELLI